MKYLKRFNENIETLFRSISKDEYFMKVLNRPYNSIEGTSSNTEHWDSFSKNDIEEIENSLIDSNCLVESPTLGKIELYRGKELVVDIIKTDDYYFYIDHTPIRDNKGRPIFIANFFECDTIDGVVNCLNNII